jgi:hypothetical protein
MLVANNRIEDFYTADGTEVEPHPADAQAAAIDALVAAGTALDGLQSAITGIDEPRRTAFAHSIARIRDDLKIATHPQLDSIAARIEGLHSKIEDALIESPAPAQGPERAGRGATGVPAIPRLELWRPSAITSPKLTAAARESLLATRAMALTAVAILVTWTYAFFSIKHATYDPKPLFAGFGDYLELFSAALGSGAAATVLGLLSDWRPGAANDESS